MATITCDNCTESEVWTKIGTASDGDTVVLPNNRPTGGTFTLTYSGQTTSAIAYNAAAATVQSALEALSNIAPGDITVIALGEFNWRITFSGALAAQDVALMTATSSVTPSTGRDVVVAEVIKGDNSPVKNEVQAVRIGAAWGSQHILNKAIKLQGAGIDNTIILDNYTGGYWIRFDLPNNKLTEITGITFKNGTSTSSGSIDGGSTLRFIGSSESTDQLRVHHCKFEELMQWPVITLQVKGVFDHNEFVRCDGGVAYIYGLNWRAETPTGTEDFGDGSWAYPTNAGSGDAIYYENNLFDQTLSLYDKTFFDGTRGGRGVVRYNTFTKPVAGHNAAPITCHGLEGRNRAIRHFEFYNNYVLTVISNKLTNNRGGTMVIFNNRVASGAAGGDIFGFQCDREGDPFPWGRATGSCPYDVNDESAGVTGGVPNPLFGPYTMIAPTSKDFITVAGTPWTGIDLVGYSVSDLDQEFSEPPIHWRLETQYLGSVIKANTANTITTTGSAFGNPHNYLVDDTFIIRRCIHAMDMVGRAGTSNDSLLTGGGTIPNPPVLPAGWNNEVTEPLYEWNNLKGATNIDYSSGEHAMITSGVHYHNDTVKPGYPWTANVETKCGAEDYTFVTLTASATNGKGGFQYPHPLVEAPTGTKIISVPLSHDFGNVIVGQTGTYDIPVENLGDSLLTIEEVIYPTGYNGPTTGFTVAAGVTVFKTATFEPDSATTFPGTIAFVSDSDSEIAGNGSMDVTGVGVAGGGGGGKGKGHKKGALSRRA